MAETFEAWDVFHAHGNVDVVVVFFVRVLIMEILVFSVRVS